MTATQRQKHVPSVADPLRDAGILEQRVAAYVNIADQQVRSVSLCRNTSKLLTCGTKTTLYSAAVASPTTVRLALSSGLDIADNKHLQQSAGLHADVQTLAVLRDLGVPLSYSVTQAVALSGRLKILQYVVDEQWCPKSNILGYYAARSGSISMPKWLRTQRWCAIDDLACAGAARAGHLAALKYLRSEGCAWDAHYIACCAAESGSIELVEWIRQQQGIDINARVMAAAARADQTAMCEHLRSTGCQWDATACTAATKTGAISTLRWLREHGCPWTVRDVLHEAADNGFTDALDYVLQQGEVLDAELLTAALNRAGTAGKLQVAQWLRQHGAEWPAVLGYNEPTYIEHWSDDVLAWARLEGCASPTVP
eukprot:12185-Heterococcus_DN1.PRE.2